MRAALLYNPGSGAALSEAALVSAIEETGWTIECRVSEAQLDADLRRRVDVVIAAGGDGTVAKVARRLAGTGLPMAIVPAGTVNNIARALGIGVDPRPAAARLAHATERRIDLGVVRAHETGPDEDDRARDYFIEGFSVGILAHVLGEKVSREHKRHGRASSLIAAKLEGYAPRRYRIEADGRDLSGDYVLVAVLNIRSIGPGLRLAPDAVCDDGELDLVRVGPESKRALIAALRAATRDGDVELPPFDVRRTKHVRIRSEGHWAHLDDEPWKLDGEIAIGIEPAAVRVVLQTA